MSSPAINTVIKMMESLPKEEQDGIVEHLREYIQDLQDEHKCHKKYREIVKRVLEKRAYYYIYPNEDYCIRCQLIISYDRNHYFLVIVGNDDIRRFFHCIFHIEIKNNQIYILHEDINESISKAELYKELDKAHIAKDRLIPLKDYRNYEEYAPHNCSYYVPKILEQNSITSEQVYNLYPESFIYKDQSQKINLKPDVNSKQLTEIFKTISQYRFTQIYNLLGADIAIHQNTSLYLLKKLFPDFPLEVLKNSILEENKILLEEIYRENFVTFHEKDLELPDYFVKWAIKHQKEDLRIVIAKNTKISKIWQTKLLEDNSCAVIQALYRNASLPPKVTEKLKDKQSELEKSCSYKNNYGCSIGFCLLAADEIPF